MLALFVFTQAVYAVKHPDKLLFWGKGNFSEIDKQIRNSPGVTAVFISVGMLSGAQLAAFQKAWNIPVYDRSVNIHDHPRRLKEHLKCYFMWFVHGIYHFMVSVICLLHLVALFVLYNS